MWPNNTFNKRPFVGQRDEMSLLDIYRDVIVKSLVETMNPSRIFIFGSCARHEEAASSDIDIAVITRPGQVATRLDIAKARSQLREALAGDGPAVDLIAIHPEMFDLTRRNAASVWHSVDREGIIIYDAL